MSIRLMSQTWQLALPHSEKLVLLALADNANDDGACWPSVKSLCEKTSLSERSVRSYIAELETCNCITVDRQSGKGSLYTIHPQTYQPLQTLPGSSQQTPADTAGVPLQPLQETPAALAGPPLQSTTVTPAIYDTPIREPLKRTIKENHQRAIKPVVEPVGLDKVAWGEWTEYRRSIGKTLKPASLQTAQEQMAALGQGQMSAVKHSIGNSYTGLFAPKTTQLPAKPSITWRPPDDEAVNA